MIEFLFHLFSFLVSQESSVGTWMQAKQIKAKQNRNIVNETQSMCVYATANRVFHLIP